MMLVTPISAYLCDKGNRIKLLKTTCIIYALYAFPYVFLLQHGSFELALIAQILFAVILGFYIASIPALLVDIFPIRTRYTGMSLSCNLAAAFFGGTVPIILTHFIASENSNYPISIYIILASVVSYFSLRLVKDSKQAI
jgi:MHS family proline/betaine transporter-like MFS transporter